MNFFGYHKDQQHVDITLEFIYSVSVCFRRHLEGCFACSRSAVLCLVALFASVGPGLPCARTKNLELKKKRGALEVMFWPFLAAGAGFLAPQMCVFREGGRAECFFSGVRFSFPLFGWRFVSTPSRSSFGFFGVRKLEALPAATQHFQTTNSSVFFRR